MQNNKTVILFLVKFFGTYALLFLLYSIYLSYSQIQLIFYSCVSFSKVVYTQSNFLINSFGYNSLIIQSNNELSYQVIIDKKPIARVIEGCNSISIIILFIAFIVAFSGKFKQTLLFILVGSLLIYIINVVRIAVITIALYKFPEYEYMLHDIFFPALIYGFTFMLWIVWVSKFSKQK